MYLRDSTVDFKRYIYRVSNSLVPVRPYAHLPSVEVNRHVTAGKLNVISAETYHGLDDLILLSARSHPGDVLSSIHQNSSYSRFVQSRHQRISNIMTHKALYYGV